MSARSSVPGLEDHFMGKLLGLPMGCDVCYTNHAAADQNSADNLLLLLRNRGLQLLHGRSLLPTTSCSTINRPATTTL